MHPNARQLMHIKQRVSVVLTLGTVGDGACMCIGFAAYKPTDMCMQTLLRYSSQKAKDGDCGIALSLSHRLCACKHTVARAHQAKNVCCADCRHYTCIADGACALVFDLSPTDTLCASTPMVAHSKQSHELDFYHI